MPLPKINHPVYEFNIPSTGKKESFRPFLVKEEKLLLIAKASEDQADIFRAMVQVINNCSVNPKFAVEKLTVFDLEYLFLQLRAVSVSNISKVSYRDNEDGEIYDFEIDLKSIQVKFPENVNKKIQITDDVGIVMRYPPAAIFNDENYFKSGDNAYYELVVRCIDKIYSGEDVYNIADYSAKEIEEFLDDCGISTFEKIQEFMMNTPSLYHELNYTNKMGNPRTIKMTSLSDFFMLG